MTKPEHKYILGLAVGLLALSAWQPAHAQAILGTNAVTPAHPALPINSRPSGRDYYKSPLQVQGLYDPNQSKSPMGMGGILPPPSGMSGMAPVGGDFYAGDGYPVNIQQQAGANNFPTGGPPLLTPNGVPVPMPMDPNVPQIAQPPQQMPPIPQPFGVPGAMVSAPPSPLEQAFALQQAGRYADAIHVYESIIYTSPPDPRLYASISDAHFHIGNHERALKYAVEALKLDPNYSSGHLLLGTILAEMGDYIRAIRAYQKVLILDQNNPYAYYNLGLLYYKKAEIPTALEYLERAKQLNPNDARIWNNLGVTYYDQGMYTQAMIAYTEALRLDPEYTSAASNLALLRQTVPPPPMAALPTVRSSRKRKGSIKGAKAKATDAAKPNIPSNTPPTGVNLDGVPPANTLGGFGAPPPPPTGSPNATTGFGSPPPPTATPPGTASFPGQ